MKINVVMPQLGESVSEGEILQWLKQPGEDVQRDEGIVEVKTDKATVEIPSPAAGKLAEVTANVGDTVQVGAVIAAIESTSESAALSSEQATVKPRAVAPPVIRKEEKKTPEPIPVPASTEEASGAEKIAKRQPAAEYRKPKSAPKMTPLARRVADEMGVDISRIEGTGEGGRITREDVLQAARKPAEKPPEAPAQEHPPSADEEIMPLSPLRRRIAARMVQSSQSIPHVTTVVEADMTGVSELREQLRAAFEKEGLKLTYMPFIMKAVVEALKAFKALNASWGEDKLLLHKKINLGIAVSVEGGLVVPVIRDAGELNIRELAKRLAAVADHARTGKLSADEAQGSTFTITNPGAFGSIFSTPIINPPEAAILAIGRIAEMPVAREGKVVVRKMTNLCLSYDHRIVDGETAIKFLQHVRRALESAEFKP